MGRELIALICFAPLLAVAAEYGDPRTQRRDNYPFDGALPITQYAPPVADGYERSRLWINSTNGTSCYEVYEDAVLPIREIPEGLQAPVIYVPDATGSNGVALVASGNELLIVDGWGSPRHDATRVRADAAALSTTNSIARARLRAIVRDVIATQALNSNATGTAAQQIARLREVADRQAGEQLRLARWLREYVVKDQLPESAP